jgi:arylformamidase
MVAGEANSGLERMTGYRGMTQDELHASYNNLAAVPESASIIEEWTRRSAMIRQRPGVLRDVAYAPAPRTMLDYFPCGAEKPPLFVFIHGGYWLRNRKDMFAFVAEGANAAGFDVATIGYTLAPEARLTRIVLEVEAALDFLRRHSAELGFDADKVIVGGWSAGGHLAALMMDHPIASGILAISGIFDLQPVALCSINEIVRISAAEVEMLSPIRRLGRGHIPICVAWGGQELSELQRQSEDFVTAAREAGRPVDALCLETHNHFTILDELRSNEGLLTETLKALASSAGPRAR